MKKIILAVMMVVSMNVYAQNGATSSSEAASVSGSQASNQGNAQAITFNSETPTKQEIKTVGQAYAPALTASFTECFGSRSGGVGFMGGSVAGGSTYTEAGCERRRDANQAVALGQPLIGFQIMCMSENFYKAAKAIEATTGLVCMVNPKDASIPYDNRDVKVKSSQEQAQNTLQK